MASSLFLICLNIAARGPAVLQRLLVAKPVEKFTVTKGFMLRRRNAGRTPLHCHDVAGNRLHDTWHLAIGRVGPWPQACLDAGENKNKWSMRNEDA